MITPYEHRQRMEAMYFEKHGKYPKTTSECADAAREYYAELHTRTADANMANITAGMDEEQKAKAQKDMMSRLADSVLHAHPQAN